MNSTQNGHSSQTMTWHTASVRDFFERMPWNGVAVAMPPQPTHGSEAHQVESSSLSLTLKVSEFFNLFPWDGKPNIATPMAPMEIQPDLPAEDSITLDGFADLF